MSGLLALVLVVVLTACQGGAEAPGEGSAEQGSADLNTKPVVTVEAGEPPSRLQVTDIVVGEGASPSTGELIATQYVGVAWSTGAEFDASWDRGAPLSFQVGVGRVIEGWDIGILGDAALDIAPMKIGGRRRIVIPPAQAYGARGAGPIGPNETLVFVVDLVDISAG